MLVFAPRLIRIDENVRYRPGADSRRLRNPGRFSAENNNCYHLRVVHPIVLIAGSSEDPCVRGVQVRLPCAVFKYADMMGPANTSCHN